MMNNKNKAGKSISSVTLETLSKSVKKKSTKKPVKKHAFKKVDTRIRTRSQRANDLFKLILEGPTFEITKDMFVESLFRRDFGQYVSSEINRFYREWAINNLVKDLKILVTEIK